MPPLLQNNVADEEEVDDEVIFEDTNQDMNHFGKGLSGGFVTEEEFLNAECYDADMFETEDDLGLKKTVVTTDVCQNELKNTVNLRSGPKQVAQISKKKVVVPAKQSSDPVTEKIQVSEKIEEEHGG